MNSDGPSFVPTHPNDVELERLGDELTSTPVAAGAMASPPAPTGSPGVSGSRSAPHASTSG